MIFNVGAYIGDVTKMYRDTFPHAMIHYFEPFSDSFRELKKLSSDKLTKLHQLAISDRLGKSSFYLNADPTCNSFYPRPKNGVKYYAEKNEIISKIEVETTTIDHFCEADNISRIDILKLDLEGAEIKALHGECGKLAKYAISLIYTEIIFISHYDGGCMFHELSSFLEQHKYTLFNLYNLKRAKNGQLRWGNAIFLSPQLRAKIKTSVRI